MGHLRYRLADVPPQPNSPPDYVSRATHTSRGQRLELEPSGKDGLSTPG